LALCILFLGLLLVVPVPSARAADTVGGGATAGGAPLATCAVQPDAATGTLSTGIDLAAPAAGRITGTVRSAAGRGLRGMVVTAYHRECAGYWSACADVATTARGTYDLGGLEPTTYRIGFSDDAAGDYVPQFYRNRPTVESAEIVIGAGAKVSGIDATMARAAHITGTVRNAAGTGLQGIWVDASVNVDGDWRYVASVETTRSGSYDLGGLKTDTYRLGFTDSAMPACYPPQWYHDALHIETAADIAVTAGKTSAGNDETLAAPGHISGTVRNAAGSGIAGVSVVVYRNEGSDGWLCPQSVSTAADGTYDVGGLASGAYRLQFVVFGAEGYAPQWYRDKPDITTATDITVSAGATSAGKDVTLAPEGHISGTVRNAAGARLQGITVSACRSDGHGAWEWTGSASTAADGSYDLGGMAAGAWRVQFAVYLGPYLTQWYLGRPDVETATEVVVAAGEATTGVDATLTERSIAVDGISPATGRATGGTEVTIFGRHFTGVTAVTFGAKNATSYTVDSAIQITATAPAGSAGTVAIRVTAAGGTSADTAADDYTYLAAPAVGKLRPATARRGAFVTISGTSFGAERNTSTVSFGGKTCTTYLSWSDTRIRCTVPSGARFGTVGVTVTTVGGLSNKPSFRVLR
jgi:hypothetical protein